MPVYRAPRPASTETYLAGRIERWLTSKGYVIGAGGVSANDIEVVVDCDRDPTADIAAYVPTDLAEDDGLKLAALSLKNALDAIRAKDPATRSPAERAVLALTVILRAQIRERGGDVS